MPSWRPGGCSGQHGPAEYGRISRDTSGAGWVYDGTAKTLTLNSGYAFDIVKDSTANKACACTVINNGTIQNGYFDGAVTNYGVISGGLYSITDNYGGITGGTFKGTVTNYTGGSITGGEFGAAIQGNGGIIRVVLHLNYQIEPETYYEDVTTGGLPTEPVRTGFEFGGWFDNASGTGSRVTAVRNTTPLYAKWYQVFNITYELNGGTNGDNPPTYAAGKGTITLCDASKEGYTFVGWTGYKYTTAAKGLQIDPAASGNLTFTAHYLGNATPVPASSPTATSAPNVVTCEEAGFGPGSYWDEITQSCVTPVRTPESTENVFLRATPIPLLTATPTPTPTPPSTPGYYTPSTQHTPGATPAPTSVPTPTPTPAGTQQAGSKGLAVANLLLGAVAIAAGVYAVTASAAAQTSTAAKENGAAGIGLAVGAFLLTQSLSGNITLTDNSTAWFAVAAAGSVTAAVMKATALSNAIKK